MIVVTGGTGLVGSHLLYTLTSGGHRVRAVVRQNSKIENVRNIFSYYSSEYEKLLQLIEWIPGDVLDKTSLIDAFQGAHQVYHTAAFVSFIPALRKKVISTNINGTANVVDACLLNKVDKLCHVSSVAALGSSPDGPSNEKMIWNPGKKRSWYSLSKFHAEMEVWRAMEEGLNAVIVNPSVVLSPGNWGQSSSALFTSIYKGLKFYPSGSTGYVDVRDVVKAMVQLMESTISSERFILNAGELTYKEVFGLIAGSIHKNPPSIPVKRWMGEIAWRLEKAKSLLTHKHPQITRETIAAGFNHSAFDNKKSIEKLNIQYIPIKNSIQEFGNFFINDLKSGKLKL